MIAEDDAFDAAIDDLRALMDAVLASDWQELHVIDKDSEIFIAREGGASNSMVQRAGSDANDGETIPAAAEVSNITAPHVGTVAAISVTLGERLEQGSCVARLAMLDRSVEIVAPSSGTVEGIEVNTGELVEFGTVLVRLAETAQ